jgi:dihydroorotate dehydrogenase
MICSMEGFTFASALELNMGYYHIKLELMLKIYVPLYSHGTWEKYEYKRLPMGIRIAPDLYQKVMSKLVPDMEYVKTTILS